MIHHSDNKLDEMIEKQELILARAVIEIEYLKAVRFLENLDNSAKMKLVEYLVPYYGEECVDGMMMVFGSPFYMWSGRSILRNVKEAIENYKQKTGVKECPDWADEAINSAMVVDVYNKNNNINQ